MMSQRERHLLLSLLVAAVILACAQNLYADRLSVSMPPPRLHAHEKVVSVTITVTNASVVSLPKIPTGWSFNISNDPAWKTTITGYMTHGVHGLDADELDYFNGLLIVEPFNKKFDIKLDLPVDIQVEIEATADMKKLRRVVYDKKDLTFRVVDPERGTGRPR